VSGLVGNVGQAAGLIAALVSLTAAVAGPAAAVDFTLTIPHDGLTRTEEMWKFFERFARR